MKKGNLIRFDKVALFVKRVVHLDRAVEAVDFAVDRIVIFFKKFSLSVIAVLDDVKAFRVILVSRDLGKFFRFALISARRHNQANQNRHQYG